MNTQRYWMGVQKSVKLDYDLFKTLRPTAIDMNKAQALACFDEIKDDEPVLLFADPQTASNYWNRQIGKDAFKKAVADAKASGKDPIEALAEQSPLGDIIPAECTQATVARKTIPIIMQVEGPPEAKFEAVKLSKDKFFCGKEDVVVRKLSSKANVTLVCVVPFGPGGPLGMCYTDKYAAEAPKDFEPTSTCKS